MSVEELAKLTDAGGVGAVGRGRIVERLKDIGLAVHPDLRSTRGLHEFYVFDSRNPPTRLPDAAEIMRTAPSPPPTPLATLGEALLFNNPPRIRGPLGPAGRHIEHRLSPATHASVEAAGSVAATRGRNLASKGLGTVATTAVGLGPLGAFVFGNAKQSLHDGRELYLVVDEPDWGFALPVHPSLGRAVREFALAINRVAGTMTPTPKPADSALTKNTPSEVITQLERLVTLKDSGAITDAEFDALKQKLLG